MSGLGVALADIQDIVMFSTVTVTSNAAVGVLSNLTLYPEGAQNPSSTSYQTPATEFWYYYDAWISAALSGGDQQLQVVKGGIPQLIQPPLSGMVYTNQNRFKYATPVKFAPGERIVFNTIVLSVYAHPVVTNVYLKFKRRPVGIPEKSLVGTFKV